MSYPYSDEDSTDSDSGIRFKTTNTRHHTNKAASYDGRSRGDSRKPEYHRRNRSRSRSRSKERSNKREDRLKSKDYRKNRHRSRTPEKYDKHRRHSSTKSSSEKYEKSQQKTSSKDNHVDVRTIIVKNSNRESTRSTENTNIKNDEYGPKLPPKNKKETSSSSSSSSSTSHDDGFMGPALPPPMNKPTTSNKQEQEEDTYGPTLPPIAKKAEPQVRDKSVVIGPTLPPHIRSTLSEAAPSEILNSIESDEDDDDDDNIVGPLPAGQSTNNPNFMKLEERALEMKINGLSKAESDSKVREEWMLELPAVHTANLGLGPRQFRAKGVPDMSDRSSWTDTPQDKLNKASSKQKAPKSDIKKEAELEHIKKRDLEQEKIVDKHKKKKKRDKSLLDIHQEKLNKKKKEESSEKEVRRPFSRDIDLKANRFDEAQKKSILKKAQLLDSRFSSGESKFL